MVSRTLSIAVKHSRELDLLAARLGVTYSAAVNLVLSGAVKLHQ